MLVMSYSLYVKVYRPKKFVFHDSTFGTPSSIEPTMRNAGFVKYTDELPDWPSPKQYAIELLGETKAEFLVYYVFKARDGHCRFITIFYK